MRVVSFFDFEATHRPLEATPFVFFLLVEISTKMETVQTRAYKRARAPMYHAWACFAHALQCFCDGRAFCPFPATRNFRSCGFTGTVTLLFQLVVFSLDWYGLVSKFHVQTCTGTFVPCMSVFGARFAVFVRRARVLPGPCPATRNLS
jgi:hypothetical protein